MARTWTILAVVGLGLSLASGAVVAGPDDKGKEPALKGPEVKERNVPGVEGQFGEGGEKRRFVAENRIPPRVFRAAMDEVLAEDAPQNVRVSDEQREKYEGWIKDFEKQTREYMRQHKSELEDLRKGAAEFNRPRGKKPGGQPGEKPGGDEMMEGGEGKSAIAAREKYQQLMAGAPKVEDLYTKIWTELSPEQQKTVDARIQKFRDEQSEQRQEQYVRQKLGRKGPDDGGPKGDAKRPGDSAGAPAGKGRPGAGVSPERRERLMQLFERLTPEQQEELLRRIEDRLQGEQSAPGQRRRPARDRGAGEEKPAPPMDEVDVPQGS